MNEHVKFLRRWVGLNIGTLEGLYMRLANLKESGSASDEEYKEVYRQIWQVRTEQANIQAEMDRIHRDEVMEMMQPTS